jgi:hypothetical protein
LLHCRSAAPEDLAHLAEAPLHKRITETDKLGHFWHKVPDIALCGMHEERPKEFADDRALTLRIHGTTQRRYEKIFVRRYATLSILPLQLFVLPVQPLPKVVVDSRVGAKEMPIPFLKHLSRTPVSCQKLRVDVMRSHIRPKTSPVYLGGRRMLRGYFRHLCSQEITENRIARQTLGPSTLGLLIAKLGDLTQKSLLNLRLISTQSNSFSGFIVSLPLAVSKSWDSDNHASYSLLRTLLFSQSVRCV